MGTIIGVIGKALLGLIGSKKVITAVVGVLATYVILPIANGKLGLGWTLTEIQGGLWAVVALLLGQGAADFGKAAKKPEDYNVG